jgi:lysophospholipase L1-like esterase
LVKIMPLGDSITQGELEGEGYRRGLWFKLNAAGFKVDFVGSMDTPYKSPGSGDYDPDHEGHSGWTADRILESMQELAEQAEPDIVLLHVGTNDLIANESVAGTVREIRQIIDILRLQNPQVVVLLAQIIPGENPKLYGSIVLLNAMLADAIEGFQVGGSPVILVDQFTGFDFRADTFDGLHPNAPGAAKMVEVWFAALEPVLREREGK